MWIPKGDSFSARFQYVEVAKHFPKSDKVARLQQGGEPLFVNVGDLDSWRQKHNNVGLYTSILQYDRTNLKALKTGNLCFDLDSSDNKLVASEATRLYSYLVQHIPEDAVRLYFSGGKGYHLEAEAFSLGITPDPDLNDIFRFIGLQLIEDLNLTTVDRVVWEPRRMWRLVNSQHQKTGLFKIPITLDQIHEARELAVSPQEHSVPTQTFSPRANEWYREWIYKREESRVRSPEFMIEQFERRGAGVLYQEGDREFTPLDLFENCPSVMRLWNKAETEHNLSHYERLFLCSLLTYTEEAEAYLHAILSYCDDYNWEKSNAHIQDWKRRRSMDVGGRPFSCPKANDLGVGCGAEHCSRLKPLPRWQKAGRNKLVQTQELGEPSPIRYAYVNRRKKPLS